MHAEQIPWHFCILEGAAKHTVESNATNPFRKGKGSQKNELVIPSIPRE